MPAYHIRSRRSFLRAAGAGAVSVTVAGCLGESGGDDSGDQDGNGAGNGGDVSEGGNFTVGFPSPLQPLNAYETSDSYSNVILDLVYETGIFIEPGLETDDFAVRPWVFDDWDFTEEDETMTVHIDVRDDLTWNDGEDLTVDDVLFTYEFLIEQEPARLLASVGPMEDVEEGDDWDVDLHLNQPVSTWEVDQLGVRIIPEHQLGDVGDIVGYETDDPIGTGPGRVTEFGPDQRVRVEFRDDYTTNDLEWIDDHGSLVSDGPFLDEARFEIYASGSALNEDFLQGELDSMYDDAFNLDNVDSVESEDGLGIVEGLDDGYRHYTVNMRSEPLDDQALRQAMMMAMDQILWANEHFGYMERGNFVVVPAYEHIRPETAADEAINEPPAAQALWFREDPDQEGRVHVEAIREFLESGAVISGEEGEFAGQEYPGSLTDFGETFQTEAAYDYSFEDVQSDVLQEADTDAELYVDGQPFEEFAGGPLTMLNYPPEERRTEALMTDDYIQKLRQVGIPVEQNVISFQAMSDQVYLEADFDIYPMGWADTSTRGVSTLYNFFHSDNAHTDETVGEEFRYNAPGYGLEGLAGADEMIDEMRTELDPETRNDLVRQVAERMYLEAPTFVKGYSIVTWPVNEGNFDGFIGDIPAPGSTFMDVQLRQIHQTE